MGRNNGGYLGIHFAMVAIKAYILWRRARYEVMVVTHLEWRAAAGMRLTEHESSKRERNVRRVQQPILMIILCLAWCRGIASRAIMASPRARGGNRGEKIIFIIREGRRAVPVSRGDGEVKAAARRNRL